MRAGEGFRHEGEGKVAFWQLIDQWRARAAVKPAAGKAGTQAAGTNPGDAVDPFASALVKAAQTAGAAPSGDPAVGAALQLGWLMAAVLDQQADLPSLAGIPLGPEESYVSQAAQLGAAIDKLKLTTAAAGDLLKNSVLETLKQGRAADPASAQTWDRDLVGVLIGSDVRLAKAYGAGRELSQLIRAQPRAADAGTALDRDRVNSILDALDDLSTALPPHASRGVALSLGRWADVPVGAPGLSELPAQGRLWRVILVGEKKATELLEPENYLDAAERLAGKLAHTAWLTLTRMKRVVVAVVVLFVAGLAAAIALPQHVGTTGAGLAGVLAALGITWKGIGGTVGKLVAQLEQPLWGAELDGAVSDAVTLIGEPPASPSTHGIRSKTPSRDYAGRRSRRQSVAPTGPASP